MNNSGTLVDRRLEAGHGDKVAIRCAGEEVTYAQLHERICAVGNTLEELGVGREDRVLMILDDSPTFPALFLGAMRMGAVPAPVSFLDTTDNFHHYARDSYAKLIVAEDALLERLPEGTMARSDFESRLERRRARRPPTRTPTTWPSGCSAAARPGFPKGVVHLHHDIPYTCETYAREILEITEDDVTFSSTKLYHAYGLGNNLTFPYWVGATTVLRPGRPDPKGLLETAEEQQPTLFFCVPTLYGAMVNLPDADEHDLSSRAHVRLRRRAARARGAAPLAGDASASTSSTASAPPRCSTSTARTGPATSARARAASRCPGTS